MVEFRYYLSEVSLDKPLCLVIGTFQLAFLIIIYLCRHIHPQIHMNNLIHHHMMTHPIHLKLHHLIIGSHFSLEAVVFNWLVLPLVLLILLLCILALLFCHFLQLLCFDILVLVVQLPHPSCIRFVLSFLFYCVLYLFLHLRFQLALEDWLESILLGPWLRRLDL